MKVMTAFEREMAIETALARTVAKVAKAAEPTAVLRPAPYFPGRCCELAKRFECVCAAAWRCTEHGEKHVGTHD